MVYQGDYYLFSKVKGDTRLKGRGVEGVRNRKQIIIMGKKKIRNWKLTQGNKGIRLKMNKRWNHRK